MAENIMSVNWSTLIMCDLMCDNRFSRRTKMQDNYEACWQTGIYEDYACELCPHNFECSGYNGDDDDED